MPILKVTGQTLKQERGETMREKTCDWCGGIIDVGEEIPDDGMVFHKDCLTEYYDDILYVLGRPNNQTKT